MRHAVNPRQTSLFDLHDPLLSKLARRRLEESWAGLFRQVVLELLPVGKLAQGFHKSLGRPTKELYSACGLVLLLEFFDWTAEEAADAYMLDHRVQYALNLDPGPQEMSGRTVERYKRALVEQQLAAEIMDQVTARLVKLLDLQTDRVRLDSTHVASNMALFGRTRLMAVALERFLRQVQRHDPAGYAALDEALRGRYGPGASGRPFGQAAPEAEARRRRRQEVAQDLHAVIERFAGQEQHCQRPTYLALVRIFGEQCRVVDERVEVKEHPGNNVMQNPSDPEATREGPKGAGYKAQFTETYGDDNEVQLIVSALPQTGAADDRASLPAVLADLERQGRTPATLLADSHYGSDADVQRAAAAGVRLVAPAPTPGHAKDPQALNFADFESDPESGVVRRCPAGQAPLASHRDAEADTVEATFAAEVCAACPRQAECPVRRRRDGSWRVQFTGAQRRLQERRRHEQSDAFRREYALRAGSEGLNSGVKGCCGLGRLRVRGQPRVFHSILLKGCGWNIRRAAASAKARAYVAQRAAGPGA